MTPKHTPEPWLYDPTKCYSPGINGAKVITGPCEGVFTADGRTTIAVFGPSNEPGSMADAARAVQCVNACAGIPDPATELARLRAVEGAARDVVSLPRLNEPMEQNEDSSIGFYTCCRRPEYRPHADDCPWLRQRDALDGLEEALTQPEEGSTPDPRDARIAALEGALARLVTDLLPVEAPVAHLYMVDPAAIERARATLRGDK